MPSQYECYKTTEFLLLKSIFQNVYALLNTTHYLSDFKGTAAMHSTAHINTIIKFRLTKTKWSWIENNEEKQPINTRTSSAQVATCQLHIQGSRNMCRYRKSEPMPVNQAHMLIIVINNNNLYYIWWKKHHKTSKLWYWAHNCILGTNMPSNTV